MPDSNESSLVVPKEEEQKVEEKIEELETKQAPSSTAGFLD